jgi:succinyl-diaminopimelate desuccinylase
LTDLLGLAAELVAIPSESHHEAAITDHLEARLRAVAWLDVARVGNNLVARTRLGRPARVVLGGHTDTVPANGNFPGRVEGETVHGLGAADMKGGLAVLLALASGLDEPTLDVTYVFYECEEVALAHNGLRRLERDAAGLLAADAAVLLEPTGGVVEAGCQGTMRAVVELRGQRAHTARAWMGRNAIHRAGEVLRRLEAYDGRRPVIDGCEYREAIQAVRIDGGVAGNVVPDLVSLTINHRFAPDRSPAQAEAHVREVVGDVDGFEITDMAPGALPALDDPRLAALVAAAAAPPRAKLGWTDVAFFAGRGVPACNFGPGDPLLAHTAGEHVSRAELDAVYAALAGLLT